MAKALIEIKEILQSWSDPTIPKKVTTKEVSVSEAEHFDSTEKGEPLFRLVKLGEDKALVEYNRAYTLKGYEQPMSRTIWLESHKPVEFSSLWNSNGVTKRLTLKRME